MRIEPGESSDRDVRPLAGSRAETLRAGSPRSQDPDVRIDAAGVVPRSIARTQIMVAGLRQMRDSLDEGADVPALLAAVRFEGEPVLGAYERELLEIARTKDADRLGRLIDNMENNVVALLARSGVQGPQQALSAAESPRDLRALLERTIASFGAGAAQVSKLRPERVIELLG